MGVIDLSVIAIFTFIVVSCGLSFSGAGKSLSGFFSAGGALPWWMSGLSLFMSFFSAGTFVVWGSIAYSYGWVAITIQWTMCIAGLLIGFFIAGKWQATQVLTAAEFIKIRLGLRVQKVYTVTFLIISTFSTGTFLYPVAKIVQVSTGIPITETIIILGLIILAYTAVGGLWAVIVTDILQFVVLTAAVLIVVPLALDRIGGLNEFIQQAPEDFFAPVAGEFTWSFIFAFGLFNLFFIAGNWAYIQRFTCVSTPKDAKKVAWLFAALYLVSPLIWMIAPMAYRLINPNLSLSEAEGAYLLMCQEVLPAGMLGLIVAGMVFATSSSINTALNITAGVITNDVYRILRPKSSESHLVFVGRLATVLLGFGTITVALLVPFLGGVVNVVMTMAALTGGALFLPPVWLLFSRFQTGASILATTFISLSVNIFFKFISPTLFNITLNRTEEMLLGVLLPALLLAIFEWRLRVRGYEAPGHKKIGEFSAEKNHEKNSSNLETKNTTENNRGIRVIAIGISAVGLTMFILGVTAETGTLIITTMGLAITAIALILLGKDKLFSRSN
ncbi:MULTISPECIES: sodium:solute symporter family protein [Cellvibrio]|uniref:SSS family transporter n=1 Tax=Cellvibrio fibrivorans TaxID=126350 RepID=A0ABU1UVM8_9GAMM|nr:MULTISPECIES: sodium:solute symporter family protein [Cellvibrio]MDR7089250.1 SSS family transporter [Cellvibrio fibrivorans]QEY14918.1 sodium transporter [Cellvibrio sp. KY-GH-1]UUA73806.1 Na+:solute symporter [Cellvibrio sp. QJXJ]